MASRRPETPPSENKGSAVWIFLCSLIGQFLILSPLLAKTHFTEYETLFLFFVYPAAFIQFRNPCVTIN